MAREASVARADVGGTPTEGAGPVARLGRAWQLLRRAAPGLPRPLDPVQLEVLDLLVTRDGQRMSELASAVGVDPSTITRAMHRMEAAGLAERWHVAGDGRVVTAQLTPEGRRLHGVVVARRAELIRAAIADFTPEEQERLADLLERFVGAVVAGAAASGSQPTAAG
jgi:DNA-binding MarR family transcriptional regulator